MTPEIQICIVSEQKWAERLRLFKVFTKSGIKIIQDIPQNLKKGAY